ADTCPNFDRARRSPAASFNTACRLGYPKLDRERTVEMLNELLIAERGARQADIPMIEKHPHVKDAGNMPTLLVQLDQGGSVSSVRPLPAGSNVWTLRDGQHNSFPFIKLDAPLWTGPKEERLWQKVTDKRSEPSSRRSTMLALGSTAEFNTRGLSRWPGVG